MEEWKQMEVKQEDEKTASVSTTDKTIEIVMDVRLRMADQGRETE